MLLIRDTIEGVQILNEAGQLLGSFNSNQFELVEDVIKTFNLKPAIQDCLSQAELWHTRFCTDNEYDEITSEIVLNKVLDLRPKLEK